ncbi:MAG: hypothetical protein JKX71_00585 [Amylibacter sp.]|nr:hypothetical protein [Amylibacter sp.]
MAAFTHICRWELILTFYQTIFLSFLVGLGLIWAARKIWPSENQWQHSLITLSGIAIISVISWLLLQILIGLPSLAQVIDLPAIFLGLLIAYGFQNAVTAIKLRSKNKFK